MDFNRYLSPYSWRYGSEDMRTIWSEVHKRKIWRKLWLILAEVQLEFGLVKTEQVEDLRLNIANIDIHRANDIESEIHHDVMAEVRTFAEQCPVGGGIIHLGMTSMDIVDNADVLRIRESLDLILLKLQILLSDLAGLMEKWAGFPVMGFTHIQPAEPTTLGYRLAQYAQDLFTDWKNLFRMRHRIMGKGFKGAVGTSASYLELLNDIDLGVFEKKISQKLELEFFSVATQTYPRKQDYDLICCLAGLGSSLYKFGLDLRILQTPSIGELSEPFDDKQVGSSAMPFKRNPINSEKIDSLARLLAQYPRVAWDNASYSILERTLDDSANRRTTLPEAFLISDELLKVTTRIINGLHVNELAIEANMERYGPFAATERVLMALGKAGADRQEMHERLRSHTLVAWENIKKEAKNPLIENITRDQYFQQYLSPENIKDLMTAGLYTGDAEKRTIALVKTIREQITDDGIDGK